MKPFDEVTESEIARGAIDSALDYDLLLLEGIAAIMKDLCSEGEDYADGPMVVRGESLWTLSQFTDRTVESLRDKAAACAKLNQALRAAETVKGQPATGPRPRSTPTAKRPAA